ncbi:hypothetical protein HYALB_00005123 [Hymenoscyphus albidus]|uniref:MARVEL domain-containing protein n=1 Tax=Hymenoscyphus albidus TaxID=595503 RepID=A0A9N9LV04_9HELO|nr:hypothetical protein HYALB_00005123 [Hymenoscyphus albidus]
MVNTQAFTLPLRILQAVFGVIELGLTAYIVSRYYGNWSPSQVDFLLFCSIWTLLILIYLVLAPIRFARFAHKYAILGAEFVTMIFWFAGFIAFAVLLNDWGCDSRWSYCKSSQAAAVFGAFEWLLFLVSTVFSAMHCWSTRGSYSKNNPNVEMQV